VLVLIDDYTNNKRKEEQEQERIKRTHREERQVFMFIMISSFSFLKKSKFYDFLFKFHFSLYFLGDWTDVLVPPGEKFRLFLVKIS